MYEIRFFKVLSQLLYKLLQQKLLYYYYYYLLLTIYDCESQLKEEEKKRNNKFIKLRKSPKSICRIVWHAVDALQQQKPY